MTSTDGPTPVPRRDTTVIDPARYREVMGHYPTGVAIITGIDSDDAPVAMIVGTFSAVSMDPPLVSFMPTVKSGTFARLRTAKTFCINVVAHDQVSLCSVLGSFDTDKFDRIPWEMSAYGAPALAEAVTHVHCTAEQLVEAGDHYIVLCAVHSMDVVRPTTPLLFFQGAYGGFTPRVMTARGDMDVIRVVGRAESVRPQLETLARAHQCEVAVLGPVNDHELTIAASSYGGRAEMQQALGERIALVPPIGEGWVGAQGPEATAAWLRRAGTKDPEILDLFRGRATAARDAGYSMALVNRGNYQRLLEVQRQLAGGNLTPRQEKELKAELIDFNVSFTAGDLRDDETYDVGWIVVPVLDADGEPYVMLRLSQLPAPTTGAKVAAALDDVRKVAAAIQAGLSAGVDSDTADRHIWAHADVWM